MADPNPLANVTSGEHAGRVFPAEDSLCERCGYPLKGLSTDAVCPECGLAVNESSPEHRAALPIEQVFSSKSLIETSRLFLFKPRHTFRHVCVSGDRGVVVGFCLCMCMAASLAWALTPAVMGLVLGGRLGLTWSGSELFGVAFLLGLIPVLFMTLIEAIGVTAFSKRRGWRVPFALAQRVCCCASVGWLPGAVLAGMGNAIIQAYAAGQPWFEQLIGLVRVGWLLYAVLFVLSLLWFETLVWIGVRQVKFANAWPEQGDEKSQTRRDQSQYLPPH